MKKIIALFLTLVICLGLSACSKSEDKSTGGKDNAVAEEKMEDLKIGTPVDMDEQVIYDENDIIIKAKKLEFGPKTDYCAQYYYEITNNSQTDIILTQLKFDINGISLYTPEQKTIVKKGETEESYEAVRTNYCEWNDIKVFKELSLNFKIEKGHQKSSDYENPDDPYGLDNYEIDGVIAERTGDLVAKTKYADKYADYNQEIDKSGTVLIQNENISVIFNNLYTEVSDFDNTRNLEAYIYCENNYDHNVTIRFSAKKINGEDIPTESNTIVMPFESAGYRFWWESKINYETIETMDFEYVISGNGEVLYESEGLVTLNFAK